ncbi:MFS transporter [Saxibacter everestensis]|uniref:MFS transporter n=1 Tax=Saxibacter everestensis TaxID=2909229 RepID=A0ABY8QS35_9MICO|nr:MFS transporter [Brevibacteriaceae bacterium ZFBP1038]
MTNAQQATKAAGVREWSGLAVLALPTLLLSLDITVLHLGVPHISAALEPTSTQLLWIVDIYGFVIAGLLVTMGSLGDRIGRRKLLLIGAVAFGAASVAAAFSTTAEMLIVSRALMGIAGATLMPSTLALISNMFRDGQQRGLAIGIWATMFSAGIALGPIVGGAMLEHFWWGSVFLLGVPVMILLIAAGPALLPEFRDATAGLPDVPSVLLAIGTMFAVTFGIKEAASHGLTWVAAGSVVLGLMLGVAFVRRQDRVANPLLDLGLFGNRYFRVALAVLFISTAAVGGIYLFLTQYFQLVAGRSPLVSGLLLLPAAVALIIASLAAPILARRFPPGLVVSAALAISAAGYVVVAQVDGNADMPLAVLGFVLVYAGGGPVTALGTNLVLGAAPPEKAGAASALSETSTELGVSLGVAVLGSVGAIIYRLGMSGAPSEQIRETLAGAISQGTPAIVSDAITAFSNGFNAAAWICAGLLAFSSLLAALSLGRTRGSGGDTDTPVGAQITTL